MGENSKKKFNVELIGKKVAVRSKIITIGNDMYRTEIIGTYLGYDKYLGYVIGDAIYRILKSEKEEVISVKLYKTIYVNFSVVESIIEL